MDQLDGEPDLETHPDIETVTTTLIAVLTRSGTQTERYGEDDTQEPLSPQISCGQPAQLVPDISTEDEEEPMTPEKLTAGERLLVDWRGADYEQNDDDIPSSASSDELFSDEKNVIESDYLKGTGH